MRLLSGMNKLYTEWSINTRDLKLSTLLQNCKNRLPDFLKTPVLPLHPRLRHNVLVLPFKKGIPSFIDYSQPTENLLESIHQIPSIKYSHAISIGCCSPLFSQLVFASKLIYIRGIFDQVPF